MDSSCDTRERKRAEYHLRNAVRAIRWPLDLAEGQVHSAFAVQQRSGEIRGQERVKKWTGGPDYFCFFSPSDDRPASINRSATTTHNQHGGCPHLSAPLYFP